MKARITAAMIVRDERAHLAACLGSLEGFAHEVVVVDTGSQDGSPAIARATGARVLESPWTGDFAAARNLALAAAREAWILYIDADERLLDFDRAELDALLDCAAIAALTVQLRPLSTHTRYREHRLFRNHPKLRFEGTMHESIVPALDRLCRDGRMHVAATQVRIDHLGYAGDQRPKHLRNLPLLRARLAREPDNLYCLAHLGATLQGLGDDTGAEAAWRRGVDIVRAGARRDITDSLSHMHLIGLLAKRGDAVDSLLDEARAWFSHNHAITWQDAAHALRQGRFELALERFRRLAAIDPEQPADGPVAYDRSIFGPQALAAMGLCAFRLGRYALSRDCYAAAARLAPHDAGLRLRAMLAQSRLDSSNGTV